MKKTVAIIGGGTSGLPALKWCLQEGLEATCFEKADNIGGIWYMLSKIKTEEATIYRYSKCDVDMLPFIHKLVT